MAKTFKSKPVKTVAGVLATWLTITAACNAVFANVALKEQKSVAVCEPWSESDTYTNDCAENIEIGDKDFKILCITDVHIRNHGTFAACLGVNFILDGVSKIKLKKLPLSLAKKLVFSDPYACAVFQHERLCDIGTAQKFRVELAKRKCSFEEAQAFAYDSTFKRTVIFGLGTTGLFIGDQIRRNHKNASILFVVRSPENSEKALFAKETVKADYLSTGALSIEEAVEKIKERLGGTATLFVGTSGTSLESEAAFKCGVLGCNGIYDSFSLGPRVSFDTMPFGFKNQLVFGSINFTQKHMESAIEILSESNFDKLVSLIDKDEFTRAPLHFYENVIYKKGSPLKTAVIWNKEYIED